MSAIAPRRAHPSPAPRLDRERFWWEQGAVVAGVDEVGRGAWAGPVTFAAAVLPSDRRVYKLRDSKLLAPAERVRLAKRLRQASTAIGIGHATNHEIDRLGMSAAMRLAARRAVDALPVRPDVCLLDGNWNFLSDYGSTNETIIRGDAHSASIAAASIVAKVARDALMTAACRRHPAYGFSSNKGYRAPVHDSALKALGPCPLHRRSWAPVAGRAQLQLEC